MAPLPPNPFSEQSEKELDDYRKNVERRQLGLSGKTHKYTGVNKHGKITPASSYVHVCGLTELIDVQSANTAGAQSH